MGPSVASLVALAWRLLDLAQSIKSSAEALATPGSFMDAALTYRLLSAVVTRSRLFTKPPVCADTGAELALGGPDENDYSDEPLSLTAV